MKENDSSSGGDLFSFHGALLTSRIDWRLEEKIPWEGEFTVRSDP